MTREEILNEKRPLEPYCFETDTEETWYKIGLHDGAEASPWVPIDGKHPLPEPGKTVLLYYPIKDGNVELSKRIISKTKPNKGGHYNGHDEYGLEVGTEVVNPAIFSTRKVRATYWMPIPEMPKGDEK